jgi:hypothetical protein
MNARSWIWAGVLLGCAAALVAWDCVEAGPSLDPSEVSGAAAGPCHDCRDMLCGYCAPPVACHEISGYCYETVRNVSKVCMTRPNGPYELCKWRVDDAGSCITQFLNACTPEHPVCVVPLAKCGPMGVCIPEGTCTH